MVDLTALLDVILIILFLVVIQINTQSKEAERAAEQDRNAAEAKLRQMQEERDLAWSAADISADERTAYKSFLDGSDQLVVTVPEGYPEKPLFGELNGARTGPPFEGESVQDWLRRELSSLEKPVTIIVLKYNSYKILWRDYRDLSQNILALRADSRQTILYQEEPYADVSGQSSPGIGSAGQGSPGAGSAGQSSSGTGSVGQGSPGTGSAGQGSPEQGSPPRQDAAHSKQGEGPLGTLPPKKAPSS